MLLSMLQRIWDSAVTQEPVSAVVGEDAEFEGKLHLEGSLRIDGYVKGSIKTKGHLVIAAGAVVEADIEAASVCIGGKLHGSVLASDQIEILKTARVYATLDTPSLIIEEGVLFHGRCQVGDADMEPPSSREPPKLESTPQIQPVSPPPSSPATPQQESS